MRGCASAIRTVAPLEHHMCAMARPVAPAPTTRILFTSHCESGTDGTLSVNTSEMSASSEKRLTARPLVLALALAVATATARACPLRRSRVAPEIDLRGTATPRATAARSPMAGGDDTEGTQREVTQREATPRESIGGPSSDTLHNY
jgi:hypothetical protein